LDLKEDNVFKMETIFGGIRKEVVEYGEVLKMCMPHIVGSAVWKKNVDKARLSDFVSVSDETFMLLVLDNNMERWDAVCELNRRGLLRKVATTEEEKKELKLLEGKAKLTKYTSYVSKGGRVCYRNYGRLGKLRYKELREIILEKRRDKGNDFEEKFMEAMKKDEEESEEEEVEKEDDEDSVKLSDDEE